MITEYIIPIVRTRIKKKQMTSMHLISGFMFVLLGAVTWAVPNEMKAEKLDILNTFSTLITIIGLVIVAVTIFLNKILSRKGFNTLMRIVELSLFLIITIYATQAVWYMTLIYAGVGFLTVSVTLYLELNAHKPEYIKIDQKGIHLKRGNRKLIEWKETKNFLVRHGNVTVNLRNNKLYQFQVHSFKKLENKETIEKLAKRYIDEHEKDYQPEW